ncbi:MAG: polymer-forming cytoskeletal protein [SAR324 cluster bacterium]|nr:polymer-forming cytoskeletal protein [SAR324 cluster bacterium]
MKHFFNFFSQIKETPLFGKKRPEFIKGATPTYVGSGMKIEGKLRCGGPIRIDGEIRGTIDCESEITIGPSALIIATVRAAKVVVNGKIEGNLFTSEHLEVLSQGYIVGNVTTPRGCMVVHEGAIIEGQCLVFSSSSSAEPSKTLLEAPDDSRMLEDFVNEAARNVSHAGMKAAPVSRK